MRAKDGVGRYGEDVAARYLAEHGYHVLARNWRCSAGEIDIVARDGAVLVICEVKTRSSVAFGLPSEAVTARKQAKLRELALHWLREHPAHGAAVRFDVASVLRPPSGPARISLVRGAF